MVPTPEPSPPPRPTQGWRRLAFRAAGVILGIAAILVFLTAGALGLFLQVLTPSPGHEAEVVVLKVVLVVGWVTIGLWLLLDLLHWRIRALAAPIAAWIWVWLIGMWLGDVAFLNWGY